MDNKEGKLPALPGSDPDSIEKNDYHGFYKVGARSFWDKAEIISENLSERPLQKCDHEFVGQGSEVICKKCRFGLVAHQIEIRNGKLFHNGEPLGL